MAAMTAYLLSGHLFLVLLYSAQATQVLYQPSLSSTFIAHQELPFTVQYADASAIEAITCVDYVQVGEYKARVPFGCFLDTNTPMLKNVDGIAGFGIPKLGARGETLPMPLLWALTDPQNRESNAKSLERKFTFFSSRDSAELQLGGFDPACVVGGQLTETRSRSTGEFVVGISSVKVGRTQEEATELLQFADSMKKDDRVLDGVLDTGTSCLVLPSSNLNGKLTAAPFPLFVSKFVEEEHAPPEFSAEAARIKNEGGHLSEPNVWLTIEGKEYFLPYETLLISNTKKPCVRGSPPMSQSSILLGDVFFRAYAVMFDVSKASRTHPATIGLGAINPDYKIIPKSSPIIPADDLMRLSVNRQELDPGPVDKLPIENRRGTQYFLELTVGTPPQLLKVALDTGSSTLGVFVGQQSMNEVMAVELGDPISIESLHRNPVRMRSIPVLSKSAASVDAAAASKRVIHHHVAKSPWDKPVHERHGGAGKALGQQMRRLEGLKGRMTVLAETRTLNDGAGRAVLLETSAVMTWEQGAPWLSGGVAALACCVVVLGILVRGTLRRRNCDEIDLE